MCATWRGREKFSSLHVVLLPPGLPCSLLSPLFSLSSLSFSPLHAFSSCCLLSADQIRPQINAAGSDPEPKPAATEILLSPRALFSLFSSYPYPPPSRASTSPPPLGRFGPPFHIGRTALLSCVLIVSSALLSCCTHLIRCHYTRTPPVGNP
ncbi:hypothetical protein V8C26DRAFT_77024 [Trichoderma gracile]